MSTNLQSKRTSLPEPDQALDAKTKPAEYENINDVTQPQSELAMQDACENVPVEEVPIVEETANIEPVAITE